MNHMKYQRKQVVGVCISSAEALAADAAARNPLHYREGKKQGTRVKSITARILKISVKRAILRMRGREAFETTRRDEAG